MDALLSQILTLVVVYGYPIVAVAALASSAGAPLPMIPILLVAGSLAELESLNVVALVVVVTLCSVAGDCLDYWLGRKIGIALIQRLHGRSKDERSAVDAIERAFARWSGVSVFFSRWLLTAFSSLVSVLAGVSDYPFRRFILFDVAGEIVSAVLFLGLGYSFGATWRYVWDDIDGLPGALACALVGIILVLYGLTRLARRPAPAELPNRSQQSNAQNG